MSIQKKAYTSTEAEALAEENAPNHADVSQQWLDGILAAINKRLSLDVDPQDDETVSVRLPGTNATFYFSENDRIAQAFAAALDPNNQPSCNTESGSKSNTGIAFPSKSPGAGLVTFAYMVPAENTCRVQATEGYWELHKIRFIWVLWIFYAFVGGVSPSEIVAILNCLGVPGPGNRRWKVSHLLGRRGRKDGILVNELHHGVVVSRHCEYLFDKDTGKVFELPRPKTHWISAEVPGVKIVGTDLWEAAQQRLKKYFWGGDTCETDLGKRKSAGEDRQPSNPIVSENSDNSPETSSVDSLQAEVVATEFVSPDALLGDVHQEITLSGTQAIQADKSAIDMLLSNRKNMIDVSGFKDLSKEPHVRFWAEFPNPRNQKNNAEFPKIQKIKNGIRGWIARKLSVIGRGGHSVN